ncbi:MAG: hypothetical protein ACKOCH_00045, partial [Bacteroidota bacterium]
MSILYSQSDNTLYQIGFQQAIIQVSQYGEKYFLTIVQCLANFDQKSLQKYFLTIQNAKNEKSSSRFWNSQCTD